MRVLGSLLALAALGGEPQFVPGEVIVAFKTDTEPGGIAAALAKGEAAQGRLDAFVATLSGRLGIPLKTKRVGSGGDVLLEVDLRELSSRLMSRLRSEARVAEAAPTDAGDVRVRLVDGGRKAGEEITRRLEKDLGFALTSRTAPKRELLLAVDVRALTLNLVERLRPFPEVEYAQPNYIVRRLGLPP